MKSGYVAVVGKANAGKSTLINVMVGEKVSIVSPRPQTTRDRILGVLTEKEFQIVFADTPGVYKSKNALTDIMMKTATESLKDADEVLYVIDGHMPITDDDFKLINKYRLAAADAPFIVAYTKTDIMPKEKIPADLAAFAEKAEGVDVFPVSARKGKNIRALKEFIVQHLPEGERIFNEDIISDRSERFMLGEIMREKILLKFDQEIPHGVAVIINEFFKNDRGVYEVNLDIVCEKPAHKAMLIGKQGRAIKEVSSFARQDMEKFLQAKVFLTTYVKVKEDWRDRPALIKEFGYEKPRGS